MDSLKQKRIFDRKEFEIISNGLLIKEKSFSKYREVTVYFDQMTKETGRIKEGKRGWLTAAIIFLVIAIALFASRLLGDEVEPAAEIFWLSFGVVCYLIYVMTYRDFLYLWCYDKTVIIFFNNKPSSEAVKAFINNILEKRKQYLRAKYAKVDLDYNKESQMRTFKNLLDEEIISEDEFDDLKKDLIMSSSIYETSNDLLEKRNPVGFIHKDE